MPIEGDLCSRRNRTLSDGFQMKGIVVGGSTSRRKGSDTRTCSHVVAGTHEQRDSGLENGVTLPQVDLSELWTIEMCTRSSELAR